MSKRYVEVEDDVMVNEKAPKYSPCGHGKPHNDCKDAVKELIESVAEVEEGIAKYLEAIARAVKEAEHCVDDVVRINESFAGVLLQLAATEDALGRKIFNACNCPQCDDHNWK